MTFGRWRIILCSRQVQLTLLGVSLAFGGLAYYQGLSTLIGYDSLKSGLLHESGYAVVASLLLGLVLTFSGLTRVVRQSGSDSWCNSFPTLRFISSVLKQRRYSRVFAASSIAYGLAFAIISSTLVYQPGLAFSIDYGVNVPSVAEALCCGGFRPNPPLCFFLAQKICLFLFSFHLLLIVSLSFLVGLKTSLGPYFYKKRPKNRCVHWV